MENCKIQLAFLFSVSSRLNVSKYRKKLNIIIYLCAINTKLRLRQVTENGTDYTSQEKLF